MKKLLALLVLFLAACTSPAPGGENALKVVASTQILGDVVTAVSGNLAQVEVLIPAGSDPHGFEPAPQDAARLAEADLVFVNGLGLEEALLPLLDTVTTPVISASVGVTTLEFGEHEESEEGHEHDGADPHVWMNPQNVKVWADNIAAALAAADPEHATEYEANAAAYKTQLDELDAWAAEQLAAISAEERVLVTDHESFGYFAEHYGFEIVGALIPSYSTASEPSAGELAALEQAISSHGVRAVFVGVSLNPSLAERVAADTGLRLVPLFTESLSDPSGPASSYLDLIRFDVIAIVEALK